MLGHGMFQLLSLRIIDLEQLFSHVVIRNIVRKFGSFVMKLMDE